MIEIIYANYDISHNSDFICDENNPDRDWWLLLQTHTPAFFDIDGEKYIMPEKTAILYPPHCPLHYGAFNSFFKNDWVRFRTDEDFIINSTVPQRKPIVIPDFDFTHYIFFQLAIENYDHKARREDTIKALFQILFYKLEEALNHINEVGEADDLISLRLKIKNNPAFDWNIPYMADLLHVSTGHLHTMYRNTFGISCMDDIIQMRIDLAKDYLSNSKIPINIISELCGYKNVEHFSRQFKKHTEFSPSTYRRNNQ